MVTKFAKVGTMRLLLLLIVMPLFLILSLIPTMISATIGTTAVPEIASNVSSIEIAPILLAPMATSGDNVYIVWPSNQTGRLEIVFRASSDNGQTFMDKVNLSNTPNTDSLDPEIASSGNDVYISWWEDYGNGTKAPVFKASNDNGRTFQSALSLSENGPIPVQDDDNNNNDISTASID